MPFGTIVAISADLPPEEAEALFGELQLTLGKTQAFASDAMRRLIDEALAVFEDGLVEAVCEVGFEALDPQSQQRCSIVVLHIDSSPVVADELLQAVVGTEPIGQICACCAEVLSELEL